MKTEPEPTSVTNTLMSPIRIKDLEVMILDLLPNTNLDLIHIYTKRILYNIPNGVKYFCFKMNIHTFKL